MENEIISKYTKSIMSEMKAGNKERANVFKLIKTKMMEFVTRSDKPVLDAKAEISILNKMIKERNDTAIEYSKAGRQELANQELFEANLMYFCILFFLQTYNFHSFYDNYRQHFITKINKM